MMGFFAAVLTFALFVAAVGVAAVLIGSIVSKASKTKWWKAWSGGKRDAALLDPNVADALDAKHDLERGLARTRQILEEQSGTQDTSSPSGGDGGGGDGGGD